MSGDEGEVKNTRVGRLADAPAGAAKETKALAKKAAAKPAAKAKPAPKPTVNVERNDDVQLDTRRASEHQEVDDPTNDPSLLTRRSRTAGSGNDMDIPASGMKPGWSYEWKTATVMGQPVDGAQRAQEYQQGWRPVPPSHFPQMLPPGFEGKVIERWGQILMMRPEHLTREAAAEDYRIAETQKRDKLKAASAVHIGDEGKGKMNPIATEFQIEGVVGTHAPKSAA